MATKILKADGKYSWRRIAIAIMVPITIFVLTTAYGRYSWMRDQCYKVATHELALIQTKEALIAKDVFLEALINKNNGILHSRDNKETDKREKGDERLLDLILKSIKQQQDLIEQRAK
jgi:hypothetical protein